MEKIEGTATISLETLDTLRRFEKWFKEIRKEIKALAVEIDTEQYEREMKKIDEMGDLSDEEIDRLVKEAAKTLKIIISEKTLKRLIQECIDDEKSEAHYVIKEMTQEEIEKIPLLFNTGQQPHGR